MRKDKGITLIALIITIIILLILAGISIMALTNIGLFEKAQQAKETTNKAQIEEEVKLAITELTMAYYQGKDVQESETLDQYIARKINGYTTTSGATLTYEDGKIIYTDKKGNVTNVTVGENWNVTVEGTTTGGTTPVEPPTTNPSTPITPEETVATSIAEAQSDDMLTKTVNSSIEDANGNKITIPAGFKIKADDTTNNATTVDKGIVIVDSNENEFVWIPIGTIYTNEERTESKTIELNRYTFDSNGTPSTYSGVCVEEDSTDTDNLLNYGNTIAKDINAFKTSATTNAGYYIGRYEARTETERSSEDDTITTVTENGSQYVYNYVTQLQAAELSRNMYLSDKFTSDLINSYAWDTAILFLQTCGTNSKYSTHTFFTGSLAPTGTNNASSTDKQCNIYDMSGNVFEYSTETYRLNKSVDRGSTYTLSSTDAGSRAYTDLTLSNGFSSFRPLLYIEN